MSAGIARIAVPTVAVGGLAGGVSMAAFNSDIRDADKKANHYGHLVETLPGAPYGPDPGTPQFNRALDGYIRHMDDSENIRFDREWVYAGAALSGFVGATAGFAAKGLHIQGRPLGALIGVAGLGLGAAVGAFGTDLATPVGEKPV